MLTYQQVLKDLQDKLSLLPNEKERIQNIIKMSVDKNTLMFN